MSSKNLYFRSYDDTAGLFDFVESLGGDAKAIAKAAGVTYPPYPTKIHYESFANRCTFLSLQPRH